MPRVLGAGSLADAAEPAVIGSVTRCADCAGDRGIVLVTVLLVMLLMSGLGVALALVASSELLIAANFRQGQETLYAAEAAVERALMDLGAVADWTPVLDGSVRGTFVDGPPSGPRSLPDGSLLDLAQAVSLANCHARTPCSSAEMDAATEDRPWGANNPRWRLFSYGRLRDLGSSGTIDSSSYVIVLVGDDPLETDGDPWRDALPSEPGGGVILVRGEAFGVRGARRRIQATIARASGGHLRVLSWREPR